MGKLWYTSKTFWVNILAIIAIVAQGIWGWVFSLELQTAILLLINIILRAITKEEIVWGRKK